ncbi:MAG: helix-turn-helix domain-containing protein [Ruminococcaceae bacterium]|nr:helix-turn-helix domain-containing protein [Oscillospiraceae bacterium]
MNEVKDMTTGERIQKARKKSKMTQKELGEKLGVSASMIGQYENDLRKPKFETIQRIAEALGVHPSQLDETLDIHLKLDENLNICEETRVRVLTENGEYIYASMTTREGKLLSGFQALNDSGKDEAIRYTEMLSEIDKFRLNKQGD